MPLTQSTHHIGDGAPEPQPAPCEAVPHPQTGPSQFLIQALSPPVLLLLLRTPHSPLSYPSTFPASPPGSLDPQRQLSVSPRLGGGSTGGPLKWDREGGGEPPSRSLRPQGHRGRPSPRLQRKQLRVCHWASVSLPELTLGSGCWELYWKGTVPLRVLDPWRGRIVAESLFVSWEVSPPITAPQARREAPGPHGSRRQCGGRTGSAPGGKGGRLR